jgi:hypothetical protein
VRGLGCLVGSKTARRKQAWRCLAAAAVVAPTLLRESPAAALALGLHQHEQPLV